MTQTDDRRLDDGGEDTVALSRRRFVRRQWARRWLAWRRVVAVVAVLAVVVAGVWLVFLSSVLAVQGVTVSGTGLLQPAAVRAAADVPRDVPLATVDLDAVRARVEALPAVRSAEVTRSWPDHVAVAVRERVAVAVVDQGGTLRGLDGTGVLFRTYDTAPEGLPLVRTSATVQADALAGAAAVVSSLPGPISVRVASVDVATADAITLQLRRGALVRWGSAEESADKAAVLAVLLAQPPASTYDVSVPGRPTLRR